MAENKYYNEQLLCPQCRTKLDYDKNSEGLHCVNEHHFSIENEIPVFVEKHDFDEHWDDNFTSEIPKTKIDTGNTFFSSVQAYLSAPNIRILDAGCGDGVQASLLTKIFSPDSKYYGIDISLSAVSCTAKRLKGSDATLIAADVANTPFKDCFFDAVFSFGVLAYTPEPEKSFDELMRVLKVGGIIGIWIYPKTKGIGGSLFSIVRKTCKIGGKHITSGIANLIVPFMGLMPTQSKMSLANASWKQCREVVMVNIAPEQLYFPDPEEIKAWFDKNGIEIITNDKSNLITIWGRKTA